MDRSSLLIRSATIADFAALHRVRMQVRENKLSDPAKVTFNDYAQMLEHNGAGWLCEAAGEVVGFAIADIKHSSIWALFVLPEWEGRGIGKKLHDMMVSWCFASTPLEYLWLTTDPGTRAEAFYQKAGWVPTGIENGEIRFELQKQAWEQLKTLANR